jgi:hypothetical protein
MTKASPVCLERVARPGGSGVTSKRRFRLYSASTP